MLTENSLRQVDDKDNNHPRSWWVFSTLERSESSSLLHPHRQNAMAANMDKNVVFFIVPSFCTFKHKCCRDMVARIETIVMEFQTIPL